MAATSIDHHYALTEIYIMALYNYLLTMNQLFVSSENMTVNDVNTWGQGAWLEATNAAGL